MYGACIKFSHHGGREILRGRISSLVLRHFWSGGDTNSFIVVTFPVQSYHLMYPSESEYILTRFYRKNASSSSCAESDCKMLDRKK